MRNYLRWLWQLYRLHLLVAERTRHIRQLRAVIYDICYCGSDMRCENCAYYSKANGQLIDARLSLAVHRGKRRCRTR